MKKKFLTIDVLSVILGRYLSNNKYYCHDLMHFISPYAIITQGDWPSSKDWTKIVKEIKEQFPELNRVSEDVNRLWHMRRSAREFGEDYSEDYLTANTNWAEYWIDKFGECIELKSLDYGTNHVKNNLVYRLFYQ
jgi:hypothetical protein